MSLVVTTAAEKEEKRIVSLASVKTRLGITGNSSDAVLIEIIDEASQMICDYLDRTLAQQTYTETIPGTGMTTLMLSAVPILSITSATYDGTAQTDYSIANYESGILYRQDGWQVAAASISDLVHDPHPGFEKPDWVFVYKAGYTMPATADESDPGASNLPASFRRYALSLVDFLYQGASAKSPNLKRRLVKDVEEEYFSPVEQVGVSGMPVSLEKNLARWKRF